MPIPAGMEDSIPKPAGTNRNVVFNFHLVGGLFRLPAILIAMLNCGTIKLETYVNVSLLMLTLAVMYCRSRPSANLNLAEISVEISLEVLTTMLNCGTIKLDMCINISLFRLTLTSVMLLCFNGTSTCLVLIEITLEVLTTIIFPYTRCMRWFYYSK